MYDMCSIWVYWDQLDANCLVLFYYTFFTLRVSDVTHIHPQERHIMHMQPDTGKCTCELTCSTLCLASSQTRRGTGHLTRALTCIRQHVHYMTLLRMDVYYIRNM